MEQKAANIQRQALECPSNLSKEAEAEAETKVMIPNTNFQVCSIYLSIYILQYNISKICCCCMFLPEFMIITIYIMQL